MRILGARTIHRIRGHSGLDRPHRVQDGCAMSDGCATKAAELHPTFSHVIGTHKDRGDMT